jgi:hypothetical protein
MPLMLYRPSVANDIYLSKLYSDICIGGDGDKVLGEAMQLLSGFLAGCQSPRICLMAYDEGLLEREGAWMWAHFEPCYDGGFLSMWVRGEKRRTKQAIATAFEVYERFFEQFPVLLGITHQPDLLDEHKHMGYTILGKVPGLKNGKDVWIMTLTKAEFDAKQSQFARLAEAIKARENLA